MNRYRWIEKALRGGLLFMLVASAAQAQITSHTVPNDSEFARLPQYCQDLVDPRRGGDPGWGREQWKPVMGLTVDHMHHYCYGLIATMRAQRFGRTQQERNHYWGRVIAECTYVIERLEKDFALTPEVYYRRAVAYANMKKLTEAVADYRASMQFKQDYYPAYSGLADLYHKNGQRDLALKVVREGLTYAPNAKVLIDMNRELGGGPAPAAAAVKPKGGAPAGERAEAPSTEAPRQEAAKGAGENK